MFEKGSWEKAMLNYLNALLLRLGDPDRFDQMKSQLEKVFGIKCCAATKDGYSERQLVGWLASELEGYKETPIPYDSKIYPKNENFQNYCNFAMWLQKFWNPSSDERYWDELLAESEKLTELSVLPWMDKWIEAVLMYFNLKFKNNM